MRRTVAGFFAALCAFALCAACATPSRDVAGKNHFPIKIISGNVRITSSGYVSIDDSLGDPSGWAPKRGKLPREYTGYKLRRGESVTVTVVAIDGIAVIECSGRRYTLTSKNPHLELVFSE